MERTTVENLKELIRAGRAKTPATKVIMGGTLVNVMSEEIYPADIAVYEDMIVGGRRCGRVHWAGHRNH